MSSIGTGYDVSSSTFSPDGRVFQVEYAQKAIENSGTSIALRGKDGVVFATEKLVTSKLYEEGVNRRLFSIDKHIGMGIGGLLADARHIVERARTEASNYRAEFGDDIPLEQLADQIGLYMHAWTLYSVVRPFGCSVIIGSYDKAKQEPSLFLIEPSGAYYGYFGCALGKGKQAAKTEMEKLTLSDLTCAELVKHAARIIYTVHDESKDKAFELELSWIGECTNGVHVAVPQAIFDEAEQLAKASLVEDSDSEHEIEMA